MSSQARDSTLIRGDYTTDNVPNEVLSLRIKDNKLYTDVLNAGPKVGTGLSRDQAQSKGLAKNHWVFRVLSEVQNNGATESWQIQFSMDVDARRDGSMDNHYTNSGRTFSDTPGMQFSDVGSVGAVPDIDSTSFSVPDSLTAPLPASGSSGHGIAGSAGFSDTGSQLSPPKTDSSVGAGVGAAVIFSERVQGAPAPGYLSIKVRARFTPSYAAIMVYSFELAPNLTFGQLVDALRSSNMFPFRFSQVNFAYMGCRHFISQAAAIFLAGGLMLTGEGHKVMGGYSGGTNKITLSPIVRHIYELLPYRYTKAHAVGDLYGSEDGENNDIEKAYREIYNPIDRGIFPSNYQEVFDNRLLFQPPPGGPVVATESVSSQESLHQAEK